MPGPAVAQQPDPGPEYRTITETDSDYDPGATYWEGRLKRLDVRPPRMRSAIAGLQKVGWRFIVQRSKDGGPWKVSYRSPIQVATARADSDARFLPMGVNVTVPAASRHENHHV